MVVVGTERTMDRPERNVNCLCQFLMFLCFVTCLNQKPVSLMEKSDTLSVKLEGGYQASLLSNVDRDSHVESRSKDNPGLLAFCETGKKGEVTDLKVTKQRLLRSTQDQGLKSPAKLNLGNDLFCSKNCFYTQ